MVSVPQIPQSVFPWGKGGLLDNSLLKILSEIHLHLLRSSLHGYLCHVAVNHYLDKQLERGLGGIPSKFVLCLGGVAPEVDYIGRAVEVFADGYDFISYFNLDVCIGGFVDGDYDASFVDAFAFPTQFDAGILECQGGELTDGVLYACGNDEVLRGVVLEDEPHAYPQSRSESRLPR